MQRKYSVQWYNNLLPTLFHLQATDGEVGIEIEVEGSNLLRQLQYHWDVHQDGSLRGAENAEYVFRGPVNRENVSKRLNYLQKKLTEAKAIIDTNQRTSVHVHLNAQKLTFKQIFNVITTYFILEDLMAELAGTTRVGNLFCLRAQDAEFLTKSIRKCIQNTLNYTDLCHMDTIRYAAVNLTALRRYGSLEFRSLRGTTDPEVIQNWVDTLLAIFDWSAAKDNPTEIVELFSNKGPDRFIQEIFPLKLQSQFLLMNDRSTRLFHGMRQAQDIAYATTWEKIEEEKPDLEVKTKSAKNLPPLGDPDGMTTIDSFWQQESGNDLARWARAAAGVDPEPSPVPWPTRRGAEVNPSDVEIMRRNLRRNIQRTSVLDEIDR